MGGEKLKLSRPYPGVSFAAFLIITGLFIVSFPLSGQTREPSGVIAPDPAQAPGAVSPAVDESTIILGEAPPVPAAGGGSSVWMMIRMVLVLALAALAIYGVVFFIKRLARPQENQDPHLKVLARVSLGTDSYAAVISLGAKAWLVGGGSGGINLISEIDDAESLETLLLEDAGRSADAGMNRFVNFRSLLSRLAQKKPASPPASPDVFHADRLRKQRDRLKGL